jgi:tellurium resistance protein TerD
MEMLNLSKTTMMLDLTKAAPGLTKLRGALNWDVHPLKNNGHEFDLDIFMFITGGGKIGSASDVVFFNNQNAYNGAVVYPRDNRSGADVAGQDDEEVFVEIAKIPANKDKVEHFVFLHDAQARGQDFSAISGGSFCLYDQNNKLIQEYKLQQFVNGTVLHVGTLTRLSGDSWGFQPVGEANTLDPNQVMQAFI